MKETFFARGVIKDLDTFMPTKQRILYVDDHKDTCALVSNILEAYEVVSARSKRGVITKDDFPDKLLNAVPRVLNA